MKSKAFSRNAFLAVALIVCGASIAAAPEPKFKVGDPAPAIDAMAWIQGEPVKSFKPGHVYIVEFWATWCGPCNAVMPHLSELQKKHAGKLTVIGVNSRETDNSKDASVAAVTAFVKKKGENMAYTVAMDEPEKMPVFNTWMIGGGSYGIPTSFVVDGSGKLVWMGHPLGTNAQDFDKAVADALAGKSDLAAARVIQAEVNETTYRRMQDKKAYQPILDAQKRKDYATVIAEADKGMAGEPAQAMRMFMYKVQAVLRLDEVKGLQQLQAQGRDEAFLKKMGFTGEGQYWTNVAAIIARDDDYSKATYSFALEQLAKSAAAADGGSDVFNWVTLANLYERVGNLPKAIEAQEKAIAIVSADANMPADYRESLEETLKEYKARNGKG